MTRINLVDPSVLTDKHLVAEYAELPRIFTAVRKHVASGLVPACFTIPSEYVLGKGHVTFFYNKVYWLRNRFGMLYTEMKDRGFNVDEGLANTIIIDADAIPVEWQGNYRPSPQEAYTNMSRLVDKWREGKA